MNPLQTGAISPAVAAQAVQWLIELQEGTLSHQRQQAWRAWRAAADEHERAWQRIESVNQRLRSMPAQVSRHALDTPPSRSRRDALKALLILTGVGITGWSLQRQKPWQPWLADLRTGIGERRDLTLDDGSRLSLNTDSTVNIRFDRHLRLVELQRGEIFLHSAQDQRPLRISTPLGFIESTGTRLGVRLDGFLCHVSIYEGSASVQPLHGQAQQLNNRQRLSFDARHTGPVSVVDDNSTAWTRGMLVVSQMRLGDFLGELSRYRHGRLGCDPQIANLRISGSYPLHDSERILALLPQVLPVEVRHFTRYWVSVQPRWKHA